MLCELTLEPFNLLSPKASILPFESYLHNFFVLLFASPFIIFATPKHAQAQPDHFHITDFLL